MQPQSFLAYHSGAAQRDKRTPREVRSLVFGLVDSAAKRHYGDDYPIMCLQTSVAVQSLLERFGIASTLWEGGICVAQVFENSPILSWGGFWGGNHHLWLITQFNEYVDLSISQLHRHPSRQRDDAIPMPAIWWEEAGRWPAIMKYLPLHRARPDLEGAAARDLAEFVLEADAALERLLRNPDDSAALFAPILHGPQALNDLFDQGCLWLERAHEFEEQGVPLPDEVLDQEREMIEAWRARSS